VPSGTEPTPTPTPTLGGNNFLAWGENGYGNLGVGDIENRSIPTQTIDRSNNWIFLGTMQGRSMFGIKDDNKIWCWGQNSDGTLGDNTVANKSSPIIIAGDMNWSMVTGGFNHTLAITTDGKLFAWGKNNKGQLGLLDKVHRSSPVQISSDITSWSYVSAGYQFSAGIRTDGSLWVWGENSLGNLGIGDIVLRSSPTVVPGGTSWKQVGCSMASMSAIRSDDTLHTWGSNNYCALASGSSVFADSRSSPEQVFGGGTWSKIGPSFYTTAAIKSDGSLWSWGYNVYGSVGNNTSGDSVSIPTQEITLSTNWTKISGGLASTVAIKSDGTLWNWGVNYLFGTCGTNTTAVTGYSSPVQTVLNGPYWKLCGGMYAAHFGIYGA